ncbi:lactoylglutathione lyase [Cyclonatronum proteinivorum]|uniref:Lactoylglutathione lyase n=1 Tax=Cyclonatronum proteinivorum TaxID=1457365 RepID=A0A345UL70_9BACT|nr:VOC family protein [Cyclonatronum proteinivorum]AXJ01222.1 lactoylglutathione lyase [Cyclonatronum proteinivorum]
MPMDKFIPTGLNHITLRVNEIERAEAFYGDILGLKLEKKMGRSMAVYRIGRDSIVLVEAETSYNRDSKDYRVDHFGFTVSDPAIIDELAAYMKEREVTIISGPANRKNGRFLFISDPDGNLIEIFHEK